MNELIVILLAAICILLVVVVFTIKNIPPPPKADEYLRETINDIWDRERQDRELQERLSTREKTNSEKRLKIINPLSGLGDSDDRIHQTNMKAEKILIPEGLSEEQRAILKDFFNL